jgi:alkylhydroperoxidase family enzyme
VTLVRLKIVSFRGISSRAAAWFIRVKRAIGRLPTELAMFGNDSPLVAGASSGAHTSLSWKQIAAVTLAISAQAGYTCSGAAHAWVGKDTGLSMEAIAAICAGRATGDVSIDSLIRFATALLTGSNTLPATEVDVLRAAGYSDAQIVDLLLAIAKITLSSLPYGAGAAPKTPPWD